MERNDGVKCDVSNCLHHVEDCKCNLDQIQVCCDAQACTKCASFEQK